MRPSAALAPRLRESAVRTRTLRAELQHGSWFGGPPATREIANLERAAVCLAEAAEKLAGEEELPSSSAMIRSALTSGTAGVVVAAALLAVPDPGRPEIIVAAVLGGSVVGEIVGRIYQAVRRRRLVAKAAATSAIPFEERIREICADVDGMLPAVEDQPDVAVSVRDALRRLTIDRVRVRE
ncbi:hypothetical protein [Asanoa iriomotensis]|uniref:Uncharacterized protein n=1 Tax=Asanoa iriomotensis TaxID=234613 RepID=A0ABQ4BYL4_9ACTN|nr:hypothetical protein [Asanoa iriomotensis]GIF55597.1 hypothetical protein Air01nite_16920 [Asanoa iriomotensis]